LICRTSLTEVLLAPSISITSRLEPLAISTQLGQTPQGLAVGPFSQFRERARIRAALVLPQPRDPEKR
jgi:hypothetical protein